MRKFIPTTFEIKTDALPSDLYPLHFDENVAIPDGQKSCVVVYTSPIDLDGLGPNKYIVRCVRTKELLKS